ncbi:MAG: GNAT family N-acetyltransferase [Melioribacteraceae bacterium]|nr:GNAT family N-acetyltransferase [Melioribacteraceae bacterium]MCF8263355.1 GNAT family N-acetyltransferase [Melioribacteraceae bacterium]
MQSTLAKKKAEYQTVNWKFSDSKILVIQRLEVNPEYQGEGNAKKLMDFAENFTRYNIYSSIRLDAYSQSNRVINFYEKRKYIFRGNANFREREYPFQFMEKEIISAYNNGCQ